MIPILLCDAVCEIVEFLRPIQVVQFHTNLHMEFLLIQRLNRHGSAGLYGIRFAAKVSAANNRGDLQRPGSRTNKFKRTKSGWRAPVQHNV